MSFVASKLIWIFISPGNFLVLLLLLGGFMCMSHGERWQRHGRSVCFNIALLLFFFGIFPVGSWMLTPLENRFPPAIPEHVDGIILVGGDETPREAEMRGQPVVMDSARRYITFATLARKYPLAKLAFTGGDGHLVPQSKMKEYEVAKTALAGLGVPVEKMVFEDKSRNTHENAVMAAELIHPTPQQNWALVTSAFHMPRTMACFRHEGWNVFPATTGYLTGGDFSSRLEFNVANHLEEMAIAAHEYYGLVAYWLLGYTDSLWPQ